MISLIAASKQFYLHGVQYDVSGGILAHKLHRALAVEPICIIYQFQDRSKSDVIGNGHQVMRKSGVCPRSFLRATENAELAVIVI